MCNDQSFKLEGKRDPNQPKIGVLLLHRLCGTPVEMRYVANGLANEGYTVSCPRLAGHGGSTADLTATTWKDWYASAEAALLELAEDCDTVIVGGLSTGAILAVLLAAKHPKLVAGTTLLAPTLWLNGWMIPWYASLFRLIRQKWLANLFSFPHHAPHGIKDARIRDFVQRARKASGGVTGHPTTPGAAVFEHGQLVREVAAHARHVAQPTLILHPREDDYADLNNATYLRDTVTGPVDLVVLDDCYHIVTVDRQRHEVVAAMVRFLAPFRAALTSRERPNADHAIQAAAVACAA